MLDADELCARLQLAHTPHLGPVRQRQLIAHFGSAQAALAAGTRHWRELSGIGEAVIGALQQASPTLAEPALAWLAASSRNHILSFDQATYPEALHALADPPVLLYVHGDPEVLLQAQLAIVGSRTPTHSAQQTAEAFASALAQSGLVITSGLAEGIDSAAHRGALKAQGLTIAVVGTGLDRVYPAKHRQLAHQIAAEGAIVSEFNLGTGVRAENFPRRNRLIAALSLGTLVIEAAIRSGSLITARLATELGKEVLAMPGSIHNPLARGCHRLIRDGAKLVETADDVLSEIGPNLALKLTPSPAESPPASEPIELDLLSGEDQRLLAVIEHHPQGIDTLASRSGLTAQAVASMLLRLELEGKVQAAGASRYQLSP